MDQASGDDGGIMLDPLAVWSHYSGRPLLSGVAALAFPATVAALSWRTAANDSATLLAWGYALTAIACYALLAEDNERRLHGNFTWGVVGAQYVLYTISARNLLACNVQATETWRRMCWGSAVGLLGIQTVIGLCYYANVLLTGRVM